MIYLLLGVLRLGFVTHYLSRPIISGFLTAGTIIISLSQVCSCCLAALTPPPLVHPLAFAACIDQTDQHFY